MCATVRAIQFVDSQKVFAQDFWIYGDSAGLQYYVMSETIETDTSEFNNSIGIVQVKYVRSGQLQEIKNYKFRLNGTIN